MSEYRNRVFYGRDCTVMREIPDEVVQTVVTSPPYFGLRKYTDGDEIGAEGSLEAYINDMCSAFKEVYRVLRPDGTVWLNLGDTYNQNFRGGGSDSATAKQLSNAGTVPFMAKAHRKIDGIKKKDLVGVPWRVAFALQEAGWYLRSDIIWAKPNPMPNPCKDRPTSSHEYVFLLTKSSKYHYDADSIREPLKAPEIKGRPLFGGKKHKGYGNSGYSGNAYDPSKIKGANKRDVWFISPKPFKGAHYAVMPWDLVDICIRAGSKPGDLILDPFMGSGTVAAVAKALGRDYVGYDLNPDYERFLEPRIAEIAKKYEAKIDSAA